MLCRGTIDEKLRWIFRLYDINGEGSITRDNVAEVILSFYDLLGRSVQPSVEEEDVQEHVDRIFEVCISKREDKRQDGKWLEFILEYFINVNRRNSFRRFHRIL